MRVDTVRSAANACSRNHGESSSPCVAVSMVRVCISLWNMTALLEVCSDRVDEDTNGGAVKRNWCDVMASELCL